MAYRAAADVEQPLISNGNDVALEVDIGNRYSSAMLYHMPAETLKWLEQSGTQKLGSFKVRVRIPSQHNTTCSIKPLGAFPSLIGVLGSGAAM
jgi:hypothetical protein